MGSTAPGRYSWAFIIAACLMQQNGAMFQSSSYNSPPFEYQSQSANAPKRGYPSTIGSESSYPGAQSPSYQSNPSQFGSSSGGYPGGPPPPPGEYAQSGYQGGPPPPQSGYQGGPPPPQSGYQGGPPPPQSGYQGGPPPPQSGYQGGPPAPQSGYPGEPYPQQGGYPGGPPPAQGGYIGGPPPPQGGYPGESQQSYAVPASGYEGGPPPRGGYQPQSGPPKNGYSNGQPGGAAPQTTYQNGASQNGPSLSSYQSAPSSGSYPEQQPPRGFPSTYQGGSQNTYPGESSRGYAPRNYPPSRGFPSRFPTKRYHGQVRFFTAPPPDPGRGLNPLPRRPYVPRPSPGQQPQRQQQPQLQQQQQQQAFVPMPSTTTTPVPTSSTTTTGLPTTVAGEIEPPEYEGVTGTGGTTTSTTPTPTPTTTTTQTTTPPPTRPPRVHHQRPPAQQNGYPPRTHQTQRNHWHPPERRYDQINTRRRGYSTYRDYQLYPGHRETFSYRPETLLLQPDLNRQARYSDAPSSIYPNEQPQINSQPQRSPWLIIQSSSGGQGYLPQGTPNYQGGPLFSQPGGTFYVFKAPAPPATTTTTKTTTTTTTAATTKVAGEYEPPDIELPELEVTTSTTTTTPKATTTTQQPPPLDQRLQANARYPPQQQEQRQQQRYPQRSYPPQRQQAQRYPPPRYNPRPQTQPQTRTRGYPETRPQATHQRYAPQSQPSRAYPPQQRPYEPYKPAYQSRQAFREPLRHQQRTYESRAARMPAARPRPLPRQSQPPRPPPAAAARSVRKEVRFHMPNHLIPKPPPTTTTPRPQRRPAAQPRNPPPRQQNYIGSAGLGRYGQQQYRWFPSEQRWSRFNTQTRGKRSVSGPEGAGPETPETHVLSSAMLEGTGAEQTQRPADPPVHDDQAVTQFELKTSRRKSLLPDSAIKTEVPGQAEPSPLRTTGQGTPASVAKVGQNIRREEADLISIINMRGEERIGIQFRKPSLEQGPSPVMEYGKVGPIDFPHSSVPLKPLNAQNINWHRLARRNNARKDLHGGHEGIFVLSVA